jgi:signal transduction histidine kinase
MTMTPSWVRAILTIRLQTKVLGANLVILGLAAALLWALSGSRAARPQDIVIVLGALAVGAGVSYALVRVALKPIDDLEHIARRVSQGRLSERVPPSFVADPGLAHLATTMNDMLDTLSASRERMRKLGADVVYEQERERAKVARDLQDSVAQTLAAASFQIAAAINDLGRNTGAAYLRDARDLLRTALEEIRNVSRSLYPRVAEDLGLPAALEALGYATRQRSLIDVKVSTDIVGVIIPVPRGRVLWSSRSATTDVDSTVRPQRLELILPSTAYVSDSRSQAESCILIVRGTLALASWRESEWRRRRLEGWRDHCCAG